MRGLFEHFKLTLLLNFRSRQAIVYGYLVPVFFLIAFGSIFRNGDPPLLRELGQLLTISILGGACFGMPTAMVAERERGVWRRYRLLPTAAGGGGTLVVSTMLARFFIVLSAAVMQIVLAKLMYGMPFPEHPWQLFVAFVCVTFAFLGMGLIIAMLADSVPAVQALGQAIFLPMIMIGGVGVPLWTLPVWARHVAGFLPGKYAVRALHACAIGDGLGAVRFDLIALMAIGAAACIAGAKMFRWDAHEKADPRQRRWVWLALVIWIAIGCIAEFTGDADKIPAPPPSAISSATQNVTASNAAPATQSHISGEPYEAITPAQIQSIKFEDFLMEDEGTVLPVAKDLDSLDAEGKARAAELQKSLADWPPGKDSSPTRRVRNFLAAAGIADLQRDEYEAAFAYLVFEKLQKDIPHDELQKILAWIILNPADDKVLTAVPELGIKGAAPADQVRERVVNYAKKLLMRLRGIRPASKK